MLSSMPWAFMIHINLNMIFYTHVEHSPTKTIYIKYYLNTHTHTHTHTHTQHTHKTTPPQKKQQQKHYKHTHNDCSRNRVPILVSMEILWEEEGFQFGFKNIITLFFTAPLEHIHTHTHIITVFFTALPAHAHTHTQSSSPSLHSSPQISLHTHTHTPPDCSSQLAESSVPRSTPSFQFSSRWYVCAWKSPYSLNPVSQNSSNVAFETVPMFIWLMPSLP